MTALNVENRLACKKQVWRGIFCGGGSDERTRLRTQIPLLGYRNYSLTKYLADAEADPREFCRAGRLLERNFQNMQEDRLPGERPDRHPAAGIWERTSPRFHRDRSRRDACPTLPPRPENNPV